MGELVSKIKKKIFALIIIISLGVSGGFIYKEFKKELRYTREDSSWESCKYDLRQLQVKLEKYYSDNKKYPNNLKELFKEIYIEEKDIVDPWKREFFYQKNKKSYILFSFGKDGNPGTLDDVLSPIDSEKHYLK